MTNVWSDLITVADEFVASFVAQDKMLAVVKGIFIAYPD